MPDYEYIPKPTNQLNEFPFNAVKVDWTDGLLKTLNRLPFENKLKLKVGNKRGNKS